MQPNTFDIDVFLNELIAEMNLQDAPQNELQDLKDTFLEQLNGELMTAISMHLENSVIDEVMTRYADETDSDMIFAQLVTHSPSAQIAMFNTLAEFKEQMLSAHKRLVKTA